MRVSRRTDGYPRLDRSDVAAMRPRSWRVEARVRVLVRAHSGVVPPNG